MATRRVSPWCSIVILGSALALLAPEARAQNLVPNPGFEGSGGLSLPIGTGSVNAPSGVPDSWRAFAVNGAIDLEVVPVAAGELAEGSPATNAVLFRVNAYGADQGFDDDNGRFPIAPGVKYQATFYVKSANADGSNQTFNFGFPLFTPAGAYMGVEPGGQGGLVATAAWQLVTAPEFVGPAGVGQGHISWRCVADGGEDAILLALPTVPAPQVSFPTALVCTRRGDEVELSWTNNEAYDSLKILRDGAELASLAPAATSYVDAGVPEGAHTYQVLATVGATSDGPTCEVTVYVIAVGTAVSVDLGAADVEEGLANTQRQDGGDGETTPATCGPEGDLRDARSNWGTEDPTPDFPDGNLYFNVTDPAVKAQLSFLLEVTVFDDPALSGTSIFLQYTNKNSTGPADIPNTFYPLENPPARTLAGSNAWVTLTWEIANAGFRSFMQGSSDFRLVVAESRRICVDKARLTYLPLPYDLVCRRKVGGVELTWANAGPYDGIAILRNGSEIASLEGSATAYLDEDPPAGEVAYQVLAVSGTAREGPSCSISVFIVPAGTRVAIDFGETNVEEGLANTQAGDGTDGENEYVVCGPEGGERPARSNWADADPTPDFPDTIFYFSVTDEAVKSQPSFRLRVTVYDDPLRAGAGLYLQYTNQDAAGPGDIPNTFYPLQDPPVRTLGGTDAWVELTWDIEDAGFRNFQQGTSDFRLGVTDGGRVCIDKVELFYPSGEIVPEKPTFHRGDANADGGLDLSDGVFVLNYLFLGGPTPGCLEAANANDDGGLDLSDGVFILNYLFLGGPAPPAPGPVGEPCGPDPEGSPSDLGCETYAPCGTGA
ncbi:MAG: hypothetical protein ACUVYA_02485 [Planctomycetota bacterium]